MPDSGGRHLIQGAGARPIRPTALGVLPEPDGLSYRQVEEIVRLVIKESQLLAFDCVELAPIEGLHGPDFLVAKLLYKLMCLRLTSP